MKKMIMLLGFLSSLFSGKAQQLDFSKYPVYNGSDLGLTYSPRESRFVIWAPTAKQALLFVFEQSEGGAPSVFIDMTKGENGTWFAKLKGDQKGKYYVFSVNIDGKWLQQVPDPYVKATGANGKRGVITNPKETNPKGWEQEKSPAFNNKTDAIIYELHVRDASIAANSGISHNGKFLGLTEKGSKNTDGLSTGLDHIRELGVTHVHLLPFYDYNSVDELSATPKYNWGYDPLNYDVPEGSYATSVADGNVRIRELKELVKTFHENGLRVVMDVVYNHTALTENSYFNQLVPGYYYRHTADGKFSNATACGNETASERPMMRKFMLESMKYWVQEFHIDGFRVDLMGVHDIETMNIISKELHAIRPDILLYGEGWTAGASPLPDSLRALKANANKLDRIAVFSDDLRDGIKGHVFTHTDPGFVSAKPGTEESVKFGIVASLKHHQVKYDKVNYSKKPYAAQPYHTVSYAECHDNHVLWDKLALSAKGATDVQRTEMHKLALSIVLTSQGIAFLHAGTEFLRSKKGVENSFESADSINAIDWDRKTLYKDVFDYTKALIRIRKEHPAFRMTTARQVADNIVFMDGLPPGVIAYTINGDGVGDSWKSIIVILNGSNTQVAIYPPGGGWKAAVENNKYVENKTMQEIVAVSGSSCTIIYQ
jgi:pullulanase